MFIVFFFRFASTEKWNQSATNCWLTDWLTSCFINTKHMHCTRTSYTWQLLMRNFLRLAFLCSNVIRLQFDRKRWFFFCADERNFKTKRKLNFNNRTTNGWFVVNLLCQYIRYGFAWTVNWLTVKWTMVTLKWQLCSQRIEMISIAVAVEPKQQP